MKNRTHIVLIISFFMAQFSLGFANDVDPREIAIDLAVGGMEEGSRPLSSESKSDKIPGSGLSPTLDSRATTTTVTGSGASQPTPDTNGGSPEPSSGDNMGADANVQGDGGPNIAVDTAVDLDSSTSVTTPGDTGGTVGANLDDAASGLEGDTTFDSEPTATEESDRSIIEADATVDTTGDSPTVGADTSIDTSAEAGIVDADVKTTADVVDQELTSQSGLQIDLGSSTTISESTLGNEIGTSTASPDAEADAGLEADVEGTGSGDDVSSDPADGLSSTPQPQL